MESKIEILIEKYFEGETSIQDEQQLQQYFLSNDVAPHLEQYRPIFGYFEAAKSEKSTSEVKLPQMKRRTAWISVAASVLILAGVGTFTYLNQPQASQDLGTYDNPEAAFRETQRALNLLSTHVNTGVESVQYIEEYETAKERIFVRY